MKRFKSLEEQEHVIKSKEDSPLSKKRNIPILPITISVIALLILIIICLQLFILPRSTSTPSAAKAYEIEVDGKNTLPILLLS